MIFEGWAFVRMDLEIWTARGTTRCRLQVRQLVKGGIVLTLRKPSRVGQPKLGGPAPSWTLSWRRHPETRRQFSLGQDRTRLVCPRDPPLRLKNGCGQDDARGTRLKFKMHHYLMEYVDRRDIPQFFRAVGSSAAKAAINYCTRFRGP